MLGWSSLLARLSSVGRPRLANFLRALAVAKAWDVPNILQASVEVAWFRRWSNIFSCAAARAFADSLLGSEGCRWRGRRRSFFPFGFDAHFADFQFIPSWRRVKEHEKERPTSPSLLSPSSHTHTPPPPPPSVSILAELWCACNRFVAHVEQFHVPLFVVLRSWGEQFEGFGVRWVSAFESHDVKASVRALAEVASGLCESDSKDMGVASLIPRMCARGVWWCLSLLCCVPGIACRSVSCVALLAALLLCVWSGSTRFGSCFVGGLTWLGLCPGFQFLFVAALLAAIAFAAFQGLLFLNSVLCPGSWTLEEVAPFRVRPKGKDRATGECPIGSMLSDLFSPQVVPLLLAHAMMMIFTQAHEEMRQQAAAARKCPNAFASEAQASPWVDVGDTSACCREFDRARR